MQQGYNPNYDEGFADHQGKPLGTAALDQMVMLSTYIPTIFGLICLGTAFEAEKPEIITWNNRQDALKIDLMNPHKGESGAVGGITGFMCICYSVACCFVASSRSPDLCRILMMARLCLALLFVGGGVLLFWQADWKLDEKRSYWNVVRAFMFFAYGIFALPESYLLFTYGSALQREIDGPMQAQTELRNFDPPGQPMMPPGQQGPPWHSQQPPPGYNGGGFEGPPPGDGFGVGGFEGQHYGGPQMRPDPYANMMVATRS